MIVNFLVAVAAIPLSSQSVWFSDDDYPAEAIEASAEGTVEVELSVDRNGKPLDCVVIKPTENKSLNSTTCRLLIERARFLPSIDNDNIVKLQTYRQTVSWKIPVVDPIAAITSGSAAKIEISDKGVVGKCVEQKFGDQRFDGGDLCQISRNTQMLEYFAKDALVNLQTIYLRMYVIPKGRSEIEVQQPSRNTKRNIIVQASFTVSKSGFIQNCKVDRIDQMFKDKNPCNGISTTSPDFQPDPTIKIPKSMAVIVDLWSEKRPHQ